MRRLPLPARLLLCAAGLAAASPAACGRGPAGAAALSAHGSIELTEVDLAPMTPARVVAVRVEEGAPVRPGDTLAVLTQAALPATVAQQRARLAQAEATLRDLRAGARPAELGRAEAELAAATADAERTAKDLARTRELAATRVVSRQQLDAAAAAADAAAGRRAAAGETLRLLRAGPRPEQVRAAEAEVASARAALAGVEATRGDLVLTAPVAGTVLGRYAEPGEVLAAGVPVLALGETARPWVRVYLPARALDRVRPGQPVRVTLDGSAGPALAGRVEAVSPRAEFTPRVALTETERADLLFGVKVAIADTTGRAKAGLPATVHWP
ncbi:MAG TPA: HlyD family efflux transporter periplasmic adaptor subunit [Gemmatimonadales bacterium]|nr:HlyD family efflux transporter periplasmic adaptor subunit [Gemmatimonadales bacterium]